MASQHQHGYYDSEGQYRNDLEYLTGTPQDFLFENPYNYPVPEEEEEDDEETAIDLTPAATPLDLSNKTPTIIVEETTTTTTTTTTVRLVQQGKQRELFNIPFCIR